MNAIWLTSLLLVLGADESQFQEGVRTTEPLTAEQQAKLFHVPEGFEVQLVASESEIQKPLNLAFDGDGRLWVTASIEYPYAAKDRPGRDTISVLEINQASGRADRISTFADQLNIPMGIYPYQDGCIAYSIPQILRLRDTDGDGQADRREVLYGNMGWPRDTHGMQNAFRRGADGWLYVNHGYSNETQITGSDGSQIQLNSGNTYRIRLDGSRVESFTRGQVNPFGSDWTDRGELITADCHSKPLTLLLRGAMYSSFGKPHDGLGYGPELMGHLHGSTGLAGVAYYEDGSFPAEYQQSLFVGNVVTSRIHRDTLIDTGETAKAVAQEEFLTCDDPWFRPVDLRFGPDGALYIADFYNRIIGHYEVPLDHQGRDRRRGRIWRVIYRGATHRDQPETDFRRASIRELAVALNAPQPQVRYLAMDELSDRVGLDASEQLRAAAGDTRASQSRSRVMARWSLFRLNQLTEKDIVDAIHDSDPVARGHAMRIAAEHTVPGDVIRTAILQAVLHDPDAGVRRAAADALGRHPHFDTISVLLMALEQADASADMLRHAIRLAIRDSLQNANVMTRVAEADWPKVSMNQLASIAVAVHSPEAAELLLKQLNRQPGALSLELRASLLHVARNTRVEQFAALLDLCERTSHWPAAAQADLLKALQKHSATHTAEGAARFRMWIADRVQRWTESESLLATNWQIYEGATPWKVELRKCEDGVETEFLSSLPGGERQLSKLVSQSFELPASLRFYVCGHRGNPQQIPAPAGDRIDGFGTDGLLRDTYVQLRLDSGRVIRRAYAPRNDVAKAINWTLDEFVGQDATLEVVDWLDDVAYAWIAVARFQPAVVNPPIDLQVIADFQVMVSTIVAEADLAQHTELTRQWITHGVNGSARAAAAAAWATHSRQPTWMPLAKLLGNEDVPGSIRYPLQRALQQADPTRVDDVIDETLTALNASAQQQVARDWATTNEGARRLVSAWERGKLSVQLATESEIAKSIETHEDAKLSARFAQLAAGLPTEETTQADAIAATQTHYSQHDRDASKGEQVFTKHCRSCHQLAGQGALVGPQLDGINKRGVTRMVEDILAPSRNVDPIFRTTVLALQDGRVLNGLLRKDSTSSWQLIDSEGKSQAIEPADVETQSQLLTSIMPSNFATLLTVQERSDLLEYLIEDGKQTASRDAP